MAALIELVDIARYYTMGDERIAALYAYLRQDG